MHNIDTKSAIISKNYRFSFVQSFSRFSTGTSLLNATILLILALVLLSSCATKMSLNEAKEVTISMSGKSFTPPPRHVDDILAILDQPSRCDLTEIEKLKKPALAMPPDKSSNRDLANFFLRKGNAALTLGHFRQALENTRTAFQYAEKANIYDFYMIRTLAIQETWFGNSERAIELFKLNIRNRPEMAANYRELADLYVSMGDTESALKVGKKGIALCEEYNMPTSRANPIFIKWREASKAAMEASILEARGKFAEAEQYRRSALDNAILSFPGLAGEYATPSVFTIERHHLAKNLLMQGRTVESEIETRRHLKENIEYFGRDSATTGSSIAFLGKTILAQGRIYDAEKLARAGIRILEDSGTSPDSYLMGAARMVLGDVLTAQYNFEEAIKQFDSAKAGMRNNKYLYEKDLARNPNLMLSLIKNNRFEEAMGLINSAYDLYRKSFGENHYFTAEVLGLRSIIKAETGKREQALKDFSDAIKVLLLKNNSDRGSYIKNQRLKIIAEAYIDLASQIRGSRPEVNARIDGVAEAFKVANALGNYSINSTLGSSSARTVAADRELSDIVRNEQDALKQIQVLQAMLADVLALPPNQQLPGTKEKLRLKLDALSNARIALLDEINKRFPKYSDFTNPPPVMIPQVQAFLNPGEVLIFVYSAQKCTYVWAIPRNGKVMFLIAPIEKNELSRIVSYLRKALAPELETFGDIPKFKLDTAYDLYNKLLKPIEVTFKDATDLLVVSHGPLGQLPFSVLPTVPFSLSTENNVLFDNYRQVPWLIRKASITRLPSVYSLVTLRTLPEGDPYRKVFAGFGDPLFNLEQLAQLEREKNEPAETFMSRGQRIHIRGIRITEKGDLDSKNISSVQLGHLNRLPDTAEELKGIAGALDADPALDVFLGKQASERQVKTMNLSDRRVIAFASHALVKGDLDGLEEPAIALSASEVTGDNEDGLLTMGEILKLRLNADWVVLSACNTGAADGTGADAVSGLGQAFFYAGTRALLVSMWPVETTSAKKLTTGLFRYQKDDRTLSRAGALQKSMLELIDNQVLKDKDTGKLVASYAHPLFWAPFIIVGDGR